MTESSSATKTVQNGDGRHGNHSHVESQDGRPLIRSAFRAMVQDFSPIWFTWCMNSGIIAILLHQHPYQFEGIRTLSTIGFVIDIVLFVVFSIIFILRFVMFRAEAFYEITNDPSQLCLLACWTIGYLTLAPNVSLLVSEAYWGGYWATILAYVMWWIGVGWMLTFGFFVFITMSRRHLAGGQSLDTHKHNTHDNPLPTLVIIPAVGVVTVAVTGAIVASYSSHMTAHLAVPIIITAFALAGIGMVLAVFLYAILWRQLLETGFPPPEQITSMFVYIGPFGQSAAALQALGSGARAWFRLYNKGTFITESTAPALDAACILGALLLVGPAAFFTLLSIYSVIDTAITTRKVRWNPGWNAIIFPTATMTTATTYMAMEMDSPAFRVLTSIQLIFLVVVFLINAGFTINGAIRGGLLINREDPRVKKQLEEKQE